MIFFESPQRLSVTLQNMLEIFGNRRAAIARELTKLHEEIKTDNLENLIESYQNHKIRGEIVILLAKSDGKNIEIDFAKVEEDLKIALAKMKPKEAVSLIADNYNLNKKLIYQKMLEITAKDEKA